MTIAKTIAETRAIVKEWKRQGLSIGLVPTMGYLHDGHASLIRRAKEECQKVVVSIFVNPMQFGANEDLSTYPRDLEADSRLCESLGVDVIFHPEPEEMYARGFCSFVDMDGLTKGLCGRSRPVHFRGVCTVVSKLFNIVTPDKAFFGEKDAQQLAVIKRMVADLSMGLEIVGCPIVREEDGLARSSRNVYLNQQERQAALVLSRSLAQGKKLIEAGVTDSQQIVQAITEIISQEPLARIDYVEAVSMETMEPVSKIEGSVLVAMAVFIGKTRLIDNFIANV